MTDSYMMAACGERKPTTRDRWTAFYRLWRMATREYHGKDGGTVMTDDQACYAFWILGTDRLASWVGLVNKDAREMLPARLIPQSMRRRMVEYRVKQSKKERDTRAAERLHRAIMESP